MGELSFFKHDIRSRSSRKMMRFLKRNGYDLYSLFWMLVEEIYLSPNFRLAVGTKDLEEWADLFFCPIEKLQHCISEAVECRLWYVDEHGLGSYRVDEELKSISARREDIAQKRREAAAKRWAKSREEAGNGSETPMQNSDIPEDNQAVNMQTDASVSKGMQTRQSKSKSKSESKKRVEINNKINSPDGEVQSSQRTLKLS